MLNELVILNGKNFHLSIMCHSMTWIWESEEGAAMRTYMESLLLRDFIGPWPWSPGRRLGLGLRAGTGAAARPRISPLFEFMVRLRVVVFCGLSSSEGDEGGAGVQPKVPPTRDNPAFTRETSRSFRSNRGKRYL
jgi:hypothetical protein